MGDDYEDDECARLLTESLVKRAHLKAENARLRAQLEAVREAALGTMDDFATLSSIIRICDAALSNEGRDD
jgi:hypothetical protein